jgi:hypothetical protein
MSSHCENPNGHSVACAVFNANKACSEKYTTRVRASERVLAAEWLACCWLPLTFATAARWAFAGCGGAERCEANEDASTPVVPAVRGAHSALAVNGARSWL